MFYTRAHKAHAELFRRQQRPTRGPNRAATNMEKEIKAKTPAAAPAVTKTVLKPAAAAPPADDDAAATAPTNSETAQSLLASEFRILSETEETPAAEIPADEESVEHSQADGEQEQEDEQETEAAEAAAETDDEEEKTAEKPAAETEHESTPDDLTKEFQTLLDEVAGSEDVKELGAKFAERTKKYVHDREEAKRQAAEATKRAETAEAALAEAKRNGTDPRPAAAGTVETMNEKQLEELEATASQFRDAAQNFIDEAATDEERAQVEAYMQKNGLDEAKLKRRLRAVSAMLDRQMPKRREQLKQFRGAEAQVDQIVKRYVPAVFDKSTDAYQVAQRLLEKFPELSQRDPTWRAHAAIYSLGIAEWDKLTAKEKKGAASERSEPGKKPPALVKPPAATGKVVKLPKKEAETEAVRQQFLKKPTREGATKLLAAEFRAA